MKKLNSVYVLIVLLVGFNKISAQESVDPPPSNGLVKAVAVPITNDNGDIVLTQCITCDPNGNCEVLNCIPS